MSCGITGNISGLSSNYTGYEFNPNTTGRSCPGCDYSAVSSAYSSSGPSPNQPVMVPVTEGYSNKCDNAKNTAQMYCTNHPRDKKKCNALQFSAFFECNQ